MDGNKSAKRVILRGDQQAGDKREFRSSSYYLSDNFVDLFAHEVRSRREPAQSSAARTNINDDSEGHAVPTEGDPTDGANEANDRVRVCVTNWKAAKEESAKRSWEIFNETGLFASACRHGLILWLADMRRSGELYVLKCLRA